ncbi:unnamed protein product, partial [Brassica rapa]
PPCASCLSLKSPFSEPHLPLPPCLIDVEKKDCGGEFSMEKKEEDKSWP